MQVQQLENMVVNGDLDHESLFYRHCAGTFLLMLYGKLRFSDVTKFQDLSFDNQYVEGSLTQNKTSQTKEKATTLLPVLVPVKSLVYPWCKSWKLLRAHLRLKDLPEQSLLPACLAGQRTIRTCSNQEANCLSSRTAGRNGPS